MSPKPEDLPKYDERVRLGMEEHNGSQVSVHPFLGYCVFLPPPALTRCCNGRVVRLLRPLSSKIENAVGTFGLMSENTGPRKWTDRVESGPNFACGTCGVAFFSPPKKGVK